MNDAQRRRWLLGAIGTAAALGGAGVAWRQAQREVADTPAELWSMRFERPEGGQLDMATLRGRPLLINFWATWCAPCVREMPALDRFHAEFSQRQGQVVGLAIDSPAPVREFIGRIKPGFPIGLAGLDGTELVHRLGNQQGGLPFTVLFDAGGRIVRRKMGETHFEELLAWSKEV